ncbi:MAG: hypothetical protein F4Y87_05405 [Synechococcus sp. SB0665_bin_28]|nr:hypothetical protein [Synechococcus sp. SB0665_bin_28]MYF19528.1 hypothetical protein [Synechococcus sp. SB0677_bin_5]
MSLLDHAAKGSKGQQRSLLPFAAKAVFDNPKVLKKAAKKFAFAGGGAGIGAQVGAGIGIAAGGTAMAGTAPVAVVAATIGFLAGHALVEAADKGQKS